MRSDNKLAILLTLAAISASVPLTAIFAMISLSPLWTAICIYGGSIVTVSLLLWALITARKSEKPAVPTGAAQSMTRSPGASQLQARDIGVLNLNMAPPPHSPPIGPPLGPSRLPRHVRRPDSHEEPANTTLHELRGKALAPALLTLIYDEGNKNCRELTRLLNVVGNGPRTIFFRLLVKNATGKPQHKCRSRLLSIQSAITSEEFVETAYSATPLMTWAHHGYPQPTEVDIRNGEIEFLDMFWITEDGDVWPGTAPSFSWFNNLPPVRDFFVPNRRYLFTLSISSEELDPQIAKIELPWTGQWEQAHARKL